MATIITSPKPFCFVLMPFNAEFDDVYEFGIKGACSDADVYCERVDEQIFLGSLLDRIYNQISRADLLIADMTGRNANVFYEVGYAHALGKNVILLTQNTEDIPFDLKHFPHIVYGGQIKNLRHELALRVKHLSNSSQKEILCQIGIELFMDQLPLSSGDVTRTVRRGHVPSVFLTMFNNSSTTYSPGQFRVGLLAPPPFNLSRNEGVSITKLPDGRFLHMLPEFEILFPGAYAPINFALDCSASHKYPKSFQVTIRVFSSAGFRDFPLFFQEEDA